jgi:ligand-binding sensor domain-containing protein/signal transduction histidine kinase
MFAEANEFLVIFRSAAAPNAHRLSLRGLVLCAWLFSVVLVAMTAPKSVLAQPATSLASQFIRTDFTVEDGLPDDVVNAILCADNGLLWVGTESGLATFDGREFRAIPLNFPRGPSQAAIHVLTQTANGDLWIGTSAGLLRISRRDLDQLNPVAVTFVPLGDKSSDEVRALLETRAGVLWAGTNHGLYRIEGDKFIRAAEPEPVNRLAEASNGHLLVVTDQRFLEYDGNRVIEHPGLAGRLGVPDDQIFNVFQDRSGTLWYSTSKGPVREGKQPFPPFSPAASQTPAYRTFEDPHGNIWISNGRGTFRVNESKLEGLASVGARSFYANNDGDLWMGTNGRGLIHFKPRVVRMYTKEEGLPVDFTVSVLATHDGKLWVGSSCGLSVFDGSRFKSFSEKDGLLNSCVWALAEDHIHDLWIGSYHGGLFRFRDNQFTQYSVAQGLISNVVFQIVVARDNSLWIATPDGLSHMENGVFSNYTTNQGLSSDRILSVHQDQAGTIWVATQAGIDRFDGKRFVPFPASGFAEGASPNRFGEDSVGDLYTSNSPMGISLIEKDRLRVVNDDHNVMDMVESRHHDLWFSSKNGIIRVALSDLGKAVKDRFAPLDYDRMDRVSGLNSTQASSGAPNIAITPDQKLWVATVKGLAMIDLEKLPTITSKPRIFLGEVTIDGKKQPAEKEVVLPAGTHHVELHLAAVDLVSPGETRLQYRMDGVDPVWLNADVSRTAVYTALPAGTHAFQVRATGSDGKWDLPGITYQVIQQPLLLQKRWFQFVCAAFFIALLSIIYLVRTRHIVRQTRFLLEARIAERERIARDLHDTFLQGIQGILLRVHTSTLQLAKTDPLRSELEGLLDQSDAVMSQGRGLVSGLRMAAGDANELPIALAMAAKEFSGLSAAVHNIKVTGETRKLNSVVYEEVIKIGREALFNAYRHANAKTIEVELDYSPSGLRIYFRDDGTGIDPTILTHGSRAGHYGLLGMRERAHKIGAKLDISSRSGHGTKIQLQIPASVAYRKTKEVRMRWLQRLFGGEVL